MKKISYLLLVLVSSFTVLAQNPSKRFEFYFGGGSQKYKGDLGSGFNFKNNTWRGGFSALAMYRLNKSFDIGPVAYIGDLGFCQSDATAQAEVPMEEQCGGGGCIGRVGLGNISSRMVSGGIWVKYKLNNNYLLNENLKIKPYVFFGATCNRIRDKMKMNCVNEGNYYSLNSGLGLRYDISRRFNIGYHATLGYFTSDKVDFMLHHSNDMYLQNNILIGFSL